MWQVNLLPHREHKRQKYQRQYLILLGLVALLSVSLACGVYEYLDSSLVKKKNRNVFMNEKIELLNKQIADILQLKEQTNALLERKQVVERLQSTRSETVYILDQLVRLMPEGLYLKSVKQEGQKITIIGLTQSQARVSALMRNFEKAEKIGQPALVEIKAIPNGNGRESEFTLTVMILREKSQKTQNKLTDSKQG
jgi:type IV pilus assembly protein PilN